LDVSDVELHACPKLQPARRKDQAAYGTESRELNRHGRDIDTVTLAVYAVAAILGWVVGGVLVVWLF
jgi:hypothetical protein